MTTERSPYIDNAKGILIIFVIIGHFLVIFRDSSLAVVASRLFFLIYMFHMPSFIIIAGYNTKITDDDSFHIRTLYFLFIYILFDALYLLGHHYLFNHSFDVLTILKPSYVMWFLLSLAIWRTIILFISKYDYKYTIPLSFLVGILIGIFPFSSDTLSPMKTVCYFPFFLIGHYAKDHGYEQIKKARNIYGALIVALIGLVILTYYRVPVDEWLPFDKSYPEWGVEPITGILLQTSVYSLEILGCVCFFLLLKSGKNIFTKIGQHTMPIYLTHGFIVMWIYYVIKNYA